jgi:hypothetical protein
MEAKNQSKIESEGSNHQERRSRRKWPGSEGDDQRKKDFYRALPTILQVSHGPDCTENEELTIQKTNFSTIIPSGD